MDSCNFNPAISFRANSNSFCIGLNWTEPGMESRLNKGRDRTSVASFSLACWASSPSLPTVGQQQMKFGLGQRYCSNDDTADDRNHTHERFIASSYKKWWTTRTDLIATVLDFSTCKIEGENSNGIRVLVRNNQELPTVVKLEVTWSFSACVEEASLS